MVNQQEYHSNSYDSHHSFKQKEMIGKWIDFSVDDPKTRVMYLQQQTIESDEFLFNPGWFSPEEATIYNVLETFEDVKQNHS